MQFMFLFFRYKIPAAFGQFSFGMQSNSISKPSESSAAYYYYRIVKWFNRQPMQVYRMHIAVRFHARNMSNQIFTFIVRRAAWWWRQISSTSHLPNATKSQRKLNYIWKKKYSKSFSPFRQMDSVISDCFSFVLAISSASAVRWPQQKQFHFIIFRFISDRRTASTFRFHHVSRFTELKI